MDILTTDDMAFVRLWREYEAVTFNPHAFLAFELRGIAHRFSPDVCEVAPELDRLYEAQSVKIRIKADANHPHWRDKADEHWSRKNPPFQVICAILCMDKIEISYQDGRRMEISLPWESFDIPGKPWLDESNMLEKAWIDKRGSLHVSIDKANREEVRHHHETTGYPAFSTAYYTGRHEVIHDYSGFDFTRVPLLETEEHFAEYDRAFMEKYGNNACIRKILGEDVTEEEIKQEEITDNGFTIHEMIGFYNFVSRIMGHGHFKDVHKGK